MSRIRIKRTRTIETTTIRTANLILESQKIPNLFGSIRVVKTIIRHYMEYCTKKTAKEQMALIKTFSEKKNQTGPSKSTHEQSQNSEELKKY